MVTHAKTARSRGMSLIETMAAVAILTIVGATVTLGGASHFRTVSASHRQTLAVEALNTALEAARSDDTLAPGESNAALPGDLPEASLRRVVSAKPDGLLEIEVAVSWQEGDAYPAEVRATTLVARRVP